MATAFRIRLRIVLCFSVVTGMLVLPGRPLCRGFERTVPPLQAAATPLAGKGAQGPLPLTVLATLFLALGAYSVSGRPRRPATEEPSGRARAGSFLETVLDSMNDALSVINVSDFRIVDVNRVFLNQYGLKREEVIGRTCYGVTHHRSEPCAPPHDVCPLEETVKTGRYASAEHVHYLPDGERVFVEVSTSPIWDGEGAVAQVVHIARDITERKRAEEVLSRYTLELEEANRLKDLFTDIIGHDLLNPISVIESCTNLLEGAESEKARELTAAIQANAAKMAAMVRNVSIYAKVSSFDQVEKTGQDLVRLLASVIERHEREAGEKGITVVFEKGGPAPVTANQIIEAVFSNILSNAIKYSPRGTTVAVGLTEEPESWIVSCSDEGEGIPDAYKESIFGRFDRCEKKGIKGSGLGLAIAKRVVGLHGGSIWVEDRPGGGSTFLVRLPKKTG